MSIEKNTKILASDISTSFGLKANDADVVKLTGNQTIAGTKTFSSTISGSINGNAATATSASKLATARTIDGMSFNGSANITHYAECSTDAATVEKAVTLAGFTLATGARITVRFTVTNTASSPTLNVNSTGAKAIQYRNSAITAGYLAANRVYEFVYDGSAWELVGDINTDANNKVTQTLTTTNAEYSLLAMADAAATANKTNSTRFSTKATLNASTGAITASNFIGITSALSANAINVATATCFTKTITAATTFTISGVPASKSACFTLVLTNGGSKTITWPSSVKWANDEVPKLTSSGVDILTFLTVDGGTTWYGTPSIINAK